jgi:biotin synthase
MIAVTRLALGDVNIASTTALQAMDPFGREMGLMHGANVLMPQVTPPRVRKD